MTRADLRTIASGMVQARRRALRWSNESVNADLVGTVLIRDEDQILQLKPWVDVLTEVIRMIVVYDDLCG
jgi:hypothetical protein